MLKQEPPSACGGTPDGFVVGGLDSGQLGYVAIIIRELAKAPSGNCHSHVAMMRLIVVASSPRTSQTWSSAVSARFFLGETLNGGVSYNLCTSNIRATRVSNVRRDYAPGVDRAG